MTGIDLRFTGDTNLVGRDMNTRIDEATGGTAPAPDLTPYAKKSGHYKVSDSNIDLETQCQDIESRVDALETPAIQEMKLSENDIDAIVQQVMDKITKKELFHEIVARVVNTPLNQENLKKIVEEVVAKIEK